MLASAGGVHKVFPFEQIPINNISIQRIIISNQIAIMSLQLTFA